MNGNKLRNLRENKGLLQKELGDKIGISASTIGMYEQERREPDNTTLKKLAQFFNVTTDYLLDNNISKEKLQEIQEKELLKKTLVSWGYMKNDEDLSNNELENLIKFVKGNKDFIKGIK